MSVLDRRTFLQKTLLAGGLLTVGSLEGWARGLPALPANPRGEDGLQPIFSLGRPGFGPLQRPDALGIRLPAGFTARIIGQSGSKVAGTDYTWHSTPDGGGTFPAPDGSGGWIYVSNSEVGGGGGGASAVVFDAQGNIVDAYRICSGTSRNCVGGATPWGSWLSCEEVDRGRVFECDPLGKRPAEPRDPLGWFDHEAIALDPHTGYLYLTEDQPRGCLYRFRPNRAGDLTEGVLEVACRDSRRLPAKLTWVALPQPNPGPQELVTRKQIKQCATFNGGEGIWYHNGLVYFTTKGDNRVWSLDVRSDQLDILYDERRSRTPILSGVDNIIVSERGDIFVAEDGGNMQIVLLSAEGRAVPFLQLTGHRFSEVTGISFSPDGKRLYFSSQRGYSPSISGENGITYEVTGPF